MKLSQRKFKSWLFKIEASEGKINALLDGHGMVLFFKAEKGLYGANEDSRVIFAKLKNPDDELPTNWEKEANFSAYDLKKLVRGESSYRLFGKDNLKGLKVIDREEAIEALRKEPDSLRDQSSRVQIVVGSKQDDPEQSPNFVRADENSLEVSYKLKSGYIGATSVPIVKTQEELLRELQKLGIVNVVAYQVHKLGPTGDERIIISKTK